MTIAKTITNVQINDVQEIINSICKTVNTALSEARKAYESTNLSRGLFYERLKMSFQIHYEMMRKTHEANNDLVSLFGLNIVQAMLLDNVKRKDLHKVKEYVGEISAQGKVNFYCKFN